MFYHTIENTSHCERFILLYQNPHMQLLYVYDEIWYVISMNFIWGSRYILWFCSHIMTALAAVILFFFFRFVNDVGCTIDSRSSAPYIYYVNTMNPLTAAKKHDVLEGEILTEASKGSHSVIDKKVNSENMSQLLLIICNHNRILPVTHIRYTAFSCDVCGKEYTSKSCVVSHKITHSNYRPYVWNMQQRFQAVLRTEKSRQGKEL